MTKADEQSNVPLVLTFITVGIPAWAVVTLGEYPPLALISIICLPSITFTLFSVGGVIPFESWLLPTITIAPPIRMAATSIDMAVIFIKLWQFFFILPYQFDDRQIDKVVNRD